MPHLVNERQVVRGLLAAEHHSVESVVVLELGQHLESEAVTVELDVRGEVIGRADDAEVRLSQIRGLGHHSVPFPTSVSSGA